MLWGCPRLMSESSLSYPELFPSELPDRRRRCIRLAAFNFFLYEVVRAWPSARVLSLCCTPLSLQQALR